VSPTESNHSPSEPPTESAPAAWSPGGPGPAHVVAIDDSKLIHRLLRARLKHENVQLHGAMSGAEGLELVHRLHPEVILLDVEMPEMDGFEVLRALKADVSTSDIPVIILSGSCDTERKVQGLDLGAHDFVTKPFDFSELQARVRAALRLRRMLRMLAQRAHIDGLSGLWNRAYFDEQIAREFAGARRHGTNLALVLCDVDRFKSINDRFGHPFGDRVIEIFATILQSERSTDIACRYGGEEFVLLMPRTDAAGAGNAAERCRGRLESCTWERRPELVITASFGVADLRLLGASSPEDLIGAADRALYQAKEGGRNRVQVAWPTAPSAGQVA